MGTRTAQLLGGLGRALITLGVLVVLFAAFQLWGTSLTEQQAQGSLADDFEERREAVLEVATPDSPVAAGPSPTPTPTSTPAGDADPAGNPGGDPGGAPAPTTVAPAAQPVVAPELADELIPDLGETVGRIEIPAIGVDKYVVEGVRRSDLRQGPGHYPETPLPGQAGNAAIAGHRTTYGAPFGELDKLVPGDEIIVETLQGRFHYEVMGHPGPDGTTVGHHIVDPYDGVVVLDDHGDDRLTLTACHPRYSARQRIVVTARLVSPPAPVALPTPAAASTGGSGVGGPDPADGTGNPADGTTTASGAGDSTGADTDAGLLADADAEGNIALDASLGWNTGHLPATLAWAAITAAAALAVVVLGRVWRRWPARLLGAPFVLFALFVTFGYLDRMMPAL